MKFLMRRFQKSTNTKIKENCWEYITDMESAGTCLIQFNNKNMITIKRTEFKELYNLACKNWKDKFNEMFKYSIFDETLDFEESFIKEMYKACTKEQIPVFEKIFKKYLKDITDSDVLSVTTYKEVCKRLKEKEYSGENKRINTFAKIDQIQRFYNNGWTPDFSDSNQYKYYPYFEYKKGSGLVFRGALFSSSFCSGLVAYFKSEEIAKHVGKHFANIYNDLY